MKAIIKNRYDYDFVDFIATNGRKSNRDIIEIIMFAMNRFGLSKDHQILQDHQTTIIFDDKIEVIFPIK
uniref:Uncharacterized protein n=1 Tax=viral metagenome TaxID=1070528 RepID=A0A6H2A3F6_9ZZZZ